LRRPHGLQHQHAAQRHHAHQQHEASRPQLRLHAQRQQRLENQRIGDQREERSKVRCAVEEIGIARLWMAGPAEPGLQDRRIGRDREERQTDRGGEQCEQPERGEVDRRFAKAGRDRERQGDDRQRHQRKMRGDGVARVEPARQAVRVGVAGEQRRLEEYHRHRPHRRRTAEQRQHHLGEHRLDGEQEQRRDEQGRGKSGKYRPMGAPHRRAPNPLTDR
jgi:hypothetical protein